MAYADIAVWLDSATKKNQFAFSWAQFSSDWAVNLVWWVARVPSEDPRRFSRWATSNPSKSSKLKQCWFRNLANIHFWAVKQVLLLAKLSVLWGQHVSNSIQRAREVSLAMYKSKQRTVNLENVNRSGYFTDFGFSTVSVCSIWRGWRWPVEKTSGDPRKEP